MRGVSWFGYAVCFGAVIWLALATACVDIFHDTDLLLTACERDAEACADADADDDADAGDPPDAADRPDADTDADVGDPPDADAADLPDADAG